MIPRTQEELISSLRSLLSSKIADIQKDLPIQIQWSRDEVAQLIISHYMYVNNNNIAQAARDMNLARTTLSFFIKRNPHIKKLVEDVIAEEKIYISHMNKNRKYSVP